MTEILARQPNKGHSGAWDYVSASRLALWLKCPLAFKLRYVDGLRTPTTAAVFVGKMVHRALELFYRHRQLGIALDACDLTIRLGQGWAQAIAEESVQFKDGLAEANSWRQTVALVTAYLEQLPGDEPRPVAVEVNLEAPLIDSQTGEDLGMPLVGVLDLVLGGAQGPTIVDFKTAGRGGQLAQIIHELQLTAYAYLLRSASEEREGGLEIRRLIKTKVPKVDRHVFEPRSAQHFRRFFAVMRAYLADLQAGRFVFRPSLACPSCEYRQQHCAIWSG